MNKELILANINDSTNIKKARIISTDDKKRDELIKYLQDINLYIFIGDAMKSGVFEKELEYTDEGANKYSLMEKNMYSLAKLRNPRALSHKILSFSYQNYSEYTKNNNFYSNKLCLLDMFKPYSYSINNEIILNEYLKMENIIKQLEYSNLDSQTIKQIILTSSPDFGFFALECLDCIDFKIDNDQTISGEYYQNIAYKNTKVLTLAKKAHSLIK